jgi:hypothetical protein
MPEAGDPNRYAGGLGRMVSPVFEFVAGEIERRSTLATLEARGTVRIALKRAGLDAAGVTRDQLRVVLERVLPEELRSRGVPRSDELCSAIAAALRASHSDGAATDSPEAIFRRLAGG